MTKSRSGLPEIREQSRPLQVGFIPDADCAPLVAAYESGLFDKYELRVQLRRETRWANVRDKIIYGELDAAHAPATLPFITNLAIESDHCACVAGMVLSLQGNAITVSRELQDAGVRDAAGLRQLVYRNWGRRTYTFGIVLPHSPPYFLLRQWLRAGGIQPDLEVRIVVVPPAQMYPTLKLGYIDGFCVGEPWTSLAAEARAGDCVATSVDLAPLHPEKVLMVRRDFAQDRSPEHEALIAALLEACAFCDQPKNHGLLADMLAQPHYVNAPAECLRQGLTGTTATQRPNDVKSSGRIIFHHGNANDPTDEKASWVVDRLYELMEQNILKLPHLRRTPVVRNVFRRDIFERARATALNQAQALKAEAEHYESYSSRDADQSA
jgi:ABC-type nitrate/sulfonate/bicarbonate transport system substrate-binding protein